MCRSPAGSAPLAFESRGFPDAVFVTLVGELDLASAPLADARLRDASTDADLVALDLSALSFMDCAGLRVLLAADARQRNTGGRLVIVSSSRQVQRLLDLAGVSARLDIVRKPSETSRARDDLPSATCVLAAEGELGLGTADAIKAVVAVGPEPPCGRFVIDLTALKAIDDDEPPNSKVWL